MSEVETDTQIAARQQLWPIQDVPVRLSLEPRDLMLFGDAAGDITGLC